MWDSLAVSSGPDSGTTGSTAARNSSTANRAASGSGSIEKWPDMTEEDPDIIPETPQDDSNEEENHEEDGSDSTEDDGEQEGEGVKGERPQDKGIKREVEKKRKTFSTLSQNTLLDLRKISINEDETHKNIETVVCQLKSELDDLCEQGLVRIKEKVPTFYIMLNNEKITKYLPSKPTTREEFLIYSTKLSLNSSSACSQLSVNQKSVSRNDVQQQAYRSDYYGHQTCINNTYQVIASDIPNDTSLQSGS
ncbi:hypothetical protein Q8A67_009575 [Cirrhinus molitorella]|uniref:Uncharacterized protein n=1 Tax=Cirrhinus molitorella TaxID=172907 RepID=A0AA88TRR1_9TELE|nr:hypothetical protein Q8A67_009575 [Cirrhinus molitorella]